MNRIHALILVASLAAVPLLALVTRADAADASAKAAASHTMQLAITETPRTADKAPPRVVHVSVPLTAGAGPSRVSVQLGTALYKIEANEVRGAGFTAFQIDRIDHASGDLHIESSTAIAVGQSAVVGRVEAPDGAGTEVTATM